MTTSCAKSVTATFRKKKPEDEEEEDSDAAFQINSMEEPLIKWQDEKMEFTLKCFKPAYFLVKFLGSILVVSLTTYLLIQIAIYFEKASLQQQLIEQGFRHFEQDAKQQFKQFNEHHQSMQVELENVNYVKDEYLKRLKNLFNFAENDMFNGDADETQNRCDLIPLNLRFDCHPESGASELSCADRGCCWNPLHTLSSHASRQVPLDVPYCYYSKNWRLYKYMNFSKDGNDFTGLMRLERNSFYKNDVTLLQMETSSIDDSTLRVKIFDPSNKRYEPPIPRRENVEPFSRAEVLNSQYDLSIDENVPGFKVMRTSDKRILFNSIGVGGFIFADQFLQISSTLPSHYIYGLGEHRTALKLDTKWQKLTLFNADQPPTENANLYGSHPFYMVMERSGKAHGVLFLNSNAMDVILQPTPAITFRTIGGIFDIYFFMGPTPADVLKQYSQIVGKPFMPPYWSLGFHLSKFGLKTLKDTKALWQRTRDALIPFDTQWNDLDYMGNNNDFTYDKQKFKDLPKFIKQLHSLGMHYIPLIDAGVSAAETDGTYPPYDEGVKQGIFIMDAKEDKPFHGKVWNYNATAWPDFSNPKSIQYYTQMLKNLHDQIEFDGAWIDMNEPSNFYNGRRNGCESSTLENPPYLPNVVGNLLARKTVCMGARHHLGRHYDLHNTFGTSQAIATNFALRKVRQKRPFIISRSTWEGHGNVAGHWTGDVYSSWHDLRMSIPEILAYSLFQVPMIGADICGFDGNTTQALCNRWMQLGAFYPFSRNHNSDDTIDQDPVSLGQLVVESSKKALNIRYYLLPYLYTLFYRAHVYGETVARPLFVEFPSDSRTYAVDTEFLWGKCLLIAPVLTEGDTKVQAYVPRGMWYNYHNWEFSFSVGSNSSLDAPLDTIPLLLRGGCALPVQSPSLTTTDSRKKPFGLLVALNETENAEGELYWDDGDSLDSIEKKQYKLFKFEVGDHKLSSRVVEGNFKEGMRLGDITIIGIQRIVRQVTLNGNQVHFEYDSEKLALKLENMSIDFGKNFELSWSHREIETKVTTSSPTTKRLTLIKRVDPLPENIVMNSATSTFFCAVYFKLIFNFIVIKYCVT